MWRPKTKLNALRDQLLLAAPEANPHEFVQRCLRNKVRAAGAPTTSISAKPSALLDVIGPTITANR